MFDGHLRALVRPHRWTIARLLLWSALLAGCTAAYGALSGPLLRALFGGGSLAWPAALAQHLPPPPSAETLRMWLPGVIIGVAALKGLAHYRHTLGTSRMGQGVARAVRDQITARVLELPPDAAAGIGTGDLGSRWLHDVDAVEVLVTRGVLDTTRDALTALALLTVCLLLDWQLAVVAFGVYPLAFWPIARFGRRLRRAAGDAHEERGALATEVHEALTRLPIIQLSPEAAGRVRPVERSIEAVHDAVVRTVRIKAFASPFTEVLGALALAGTVLYAGHRIASGALAPEHMIGFFATLLMLYQPVKGIVRAQAALQPGRAALDRIIELLEHPAWLPVGGAQPPPKRPPVVRLEGVSIKRGRRTVIDGLSAELAPGRVTALVGPNGAGKTTLAWAIGALLPVAQGRILIDDTPLDELDLRAWRAQIGWVTQHLDIGRGSIRDNVLFGVDDDTALARVAARVGLDRVVERAPDGWKTVLGDAGAGLSGGERQRVALARGLIHGPRLLILDEADAHLDDSARAALRELLPSLRGDCTVLVITHDPAVAGWADQVVELGVSLSGEPEALGQGSQR